MVDADRHGPPAGVAPLPSPPGEVPPRPPRPAADRPEWLLPPGVPRGVWDYARARHIAEQYDDYFAQNRLFAFDQEVLARYCVEPGLVVDLGCGTGRALLPLARRGFPCLGVDLSPAMLRVLGEKARRQSLPVWRVQANLVQLDCLRTHSARYCLCLFSTLGMVQGRAHRQRVVAHARRILRPGGLLILHAHNLWFNLFDPLGRRWLARHLLATAFSRSQERGDKVFDYRGIPGMFLHTFTRGELRHLLQTAGLEIQAWILLDAARQRPLRYPWWFGPWRANGWIVVCRSPD